MALAGTKRARHQENEKRTKQHQHYEDEEDEKCPSRNERREVQFAY